MNYFAHALPFLDRPFFVAGASVPDWLTVADRPLRLRPRHAQAYEDAPEHFVAEVARGVLQHLGDDARFHETRAFAETSLALSSLARQALQEENGMRPAFLGHLLVELLLDAALIADDPERLKEYYRLMDALDAERIEAAVNRMAPRPTRRLAGFIELFRRERVLWDYLEDDRLMTRLGQVMRRVGLELLPVHFAALLPAAREIVAARRTELLAGIPTPGESHAPGAEFCERKDAHYGIKPR
ncbi:MAG: hypothetical protein JW959_04320 [Pirellulales bacterium]|nr:hypothetical protein [Pirellulales bacterium]